MELGRIGVVVGIALTLSSCTGRTAANRESAEMVKGGCSTEAGRDLFVRGCLRGFDKQNAAQSGAEVWDQLAERWKIARADVPAVYCRRLAVAVGNDFFTSEELVDMSARSRKKSPALMKKFFELMSRPLSDDERSARR